MFASRISYAPRHHVGIYPAAHPRGWGCASPILCYSRFEAEERQRVIMWGVGGLSTPRASALSSLLCPDVEVLSGEYSRRLNNQSSPSGLCFPCFRRTVMQQNFIHFSPTERVWTDSLVEQCSMTSNVKSLQESSNRPLYTR